MSKKIRTGDVGRRIQPKLRMVKNASTRVNVIRAEHNSALAARSEQVVRREAPRRVRTEDAVPVKKSELRREKRGRIGKEVAEDIVSSVFVEVTSPEAVARIPGLRAVQGNIVSATMSLSDLEKLSHEPGISHIEMGEPVKAPLPLEGPPSRRAPTVAKRRVKHRNLHKDGADVLIGIIDVQGFDFAHEDFLKGAGTRFERIWDQGGNARPHPEVDTAEGRFDYGAEFHKTHLDRAIRVAPQLGVPPWEVERQSQIAPGSHATHVASIAAGNRGVCRKAKIAGVLISLPQEDEDRRLSFYDSSRIADAVDYLIHLAPELGCKAVSINVSLGTNGHAHDASSAVSRWIDSQLSTPGRSVCVAAGNAGQEAPTSAGDIGFVMGRIHTSGRIPASGLERSIEWVVVGNGIADISENELEIWYPSQDRFAVSVRPPGQDFLPTVEPGQFIENEQLDDGSFVSVYNELYHAANGANYIGIYLSPFLTNTGVVGIPAGTWTVLLHGREVRDGHYHGWIERDDPRRLGRFGDRQVWRFPSFFSRRSNVDNSSVSSLACGHRIISVANLDKAAGAPNVTSSQGPTRDGREKPEVVAEGTDILAARGFSGPGEPVWTEKTGTSMASPLVAGVVGLMLATDPTLTAAQIGGVLRRTAHPLPGTDFRWKNDSGYGEIDDDACVLEASKVNLNEDLTS